MTAETTTHVDGLSLTSGFLWVESIVLAPGVVLNLFILARLGSVVLFKGP